MIQKYSVCSFCLSIKLTDLSMWAIWCCYYKHHEDYLEIDGTGGEAKTANMKFDEVVGPSLHYSNVSKFMAVVTCYIIEEIGLIIMCLNLETRFIVSWRYLVATWLACTTPAADALSTLLHYIPSFCAALKWQQRVLNQIAAYPTQLSWTLFSWLIKYWVRSFTSFKDKISTQATGC